MNRITGLLNTFFGELLTFSGVINPYLGVLETYLVAIILNLELSDTYSGVLKTLLKALNLYSGVLESHSGVLASHLGVSGRLFLTHFRGFWVLRREDLTLRSGFLGILKTAKTIKIYCIGLNTSFNNLINFSSEV